MRGLIVVGVVIGAFVGAFLGCGFAVSGDGSDDPSKPGASIPQPGLLPDGAVVLPDGGIDTAPDGSGGGGGGGDGDAGPDGSLSCNAVLASDPLNCGACGHSCLGGACASGKCQPVVLASNEVSASAVAVDGTFVYFTLLNAGFIRKVPIAGGAATNVFNTMKAPHDLLFDVDRLYWGDQERAGFVGVSGAVVDASAFSPAVGMFGARAIAKTGVGVYTLSGDSIMYFGRGMNQLNGTVGTAGGQYALAVSPTQVYWSASGKVHTANIGAQSELPTALDSAPKSFAIHNGFLYFTQDNSILRAPLTAPTTQTTLAASESDPQALTVDDSGVYWLNWTTGTVRHISLTGTPAAETLATNQPQLSNPPLPRVITLDAKTIYFVSSQNNTVSKLAK